jgi:CubicO group peptidase (beta-lactamase class C family)
MTRDTGGQAANSNLESSFTINRARDLDLGGEYQIPSGDPVSLFGSGFAKTMVSNIFLSGLDPDFCARNTGYFTAPLQDRIHVQAYEVNHETKSVEVRLSNNVTRTARLFQSQGAITLPLDTGKLYFEPSTITPSLTVQHTCDWPDTLQHELPPGINANKLDEAVDLAFADEAMTAGFVVTHKGNIIAERYGPDINRHTPLESWSMGKSLTATMLGILVQRGNYELDQAAPIPGWEHDVRSEITIRNILNMSSGLRFRAMQDPGYDPALGYPDHLYVYTGGINAFEFAATRKQQWLPGSVGRYRNCDPVLANYLIRLAVEAGGEDYHAFPQRSLFDKLGISSFTLETDPYGNFLTQGYEFGSSRDWARLGNLYLNDGVWNNERILPEGWVDFVSTLAPSWVADKRPIYGGFFWINGDGSMPIPKESYFMAGAGDQRTIIIPSHDLVVVRLGHYGGFPKSTAHLNLALARLMEAIPAS